MSFPISRALIGRVPVVRDLAVFWRLFLRPVSPVADTDRSNNYLKEKGWPRSFFTGIPESRNGEPIPWFTYAATDFLAERVRKEHRVFEYGCGQSTLWWTRFGCRVVSCESSPEWAERVRRLAGPAAEILVHDVRSDGYVREVLRGGRQYEIVLIDGFRRVDCTRVAVTALTEDGVLVFDNSEREKYRPALTLLAQQGFRRIDFDGLGPVNAYGWRTTVFYRSNNCLSI